MFGYTDVSISLHLNNRQCKKKLTQPSQIKQLKVHLYLFKFLLQNNQKKMLTDVVKIQTSQNKLYEYVLKYTNLTIIFTTNAVLPAIMTRYTNVRVNTYNTNAHTSNRFPIVIVEKHNQQRMPMSFAYQIRKGKHFRLSLRTLI